MYARIDDFIGTDEEYVNYLEVLVNTLRLCHSHGNSGCTATAPPPSYSFWTPDIPPVVTGCGPLVQPASVHEYPLPSSFAPLWTPDVALPVIGHELPVQSEYEQQLPTPPAFTPDWTPHAVPSVTSCRPHVQQDILKQISTPPVATASSRRVAKRPRQGDAVFTPIFYQGPPRPLSDHALKWRHGVNALMCDTPADGIWRSQLEEIGLLQALSKDQIDKFLIGNTAAPNLVNRAMVTLQPSSSLASDKALEKRYTKVEIQLLQRLSRFARAAAQSDTTNELDSMSKKLRSIILLSACAVLRAIGFSAKHVWDIAREFFGSVTDDYCQKMTRVALWVNRLMDMLESSGWGPPALQLLLFWNKNPNFYRQFAGSDEISATYMRDILMHRGTMYQSMHKDDTHQAMYIPVMVNKILGGHLKTPLISKALGYRVPWPNADGYTISTPFKDIPLEVVKRHGTRAPNYGSSGQQADEQVTNEPEFSDVHFMVPQARLWVARRF